MSVVPAHFSSDCPRFLFEVNLLVVIAPKPFGERIILFCIATSSPFDFHCCNFNLSLLFVFFLSMSTHLRMKKL
jgi:hypothetical protein